MFKKILVAVDGSSHSDYALKFGAGIAKQNNARLYLIHVVKRTKIPEELGEYMHAEGIKETPHVVYMKTIESDIIGEAKDRLFDWGIKDAKSCIITGDPAGEIIEYAKDHDIDMIVMGSRGFGGVKNLLMGSVSSKVCHGSDRTCVIARKKLLDGKKVLVVDDEPDILDSLEELLDMCDVVKAASYEEGKELLESQSFDIAILDIMGVEGFDLLDCAKEKGVITVMLTAHALSPETIVKSHEKGADSYIPKDRMIEITTFLNDILEAREKGMPTWRKLFERLGTYFENRFGPDWMLDDKKFLDKYINYYS